MISQALVLHGNQILMVKQYVQRGDIVWYYPGGRIDKRTLQRLLEVNFFLI